MVLSNAPSIHMTIVGFGQAGTRMADKFARVKDRDNNFVYNVLALNSNDGDLQELKYIPKENQISLKLGGLGKNPERAISILEDNHDAKQKLKEFITERVRPKDDLVLFFAGLGGGTGTSTIVKSVEEFFEHYNKPIIIEELKKIQKSVSAEEFKKNIKKYQIQALKQAEYKLKKVGLVVTLPVRSDGPDVLRQVNDFSNRIWKSAKNVAKGIAFVIFADNQYFYDQWKKDEVNSPYENYRDYANEEIFSAIHEINVATNQGGTDVTMDRQDFRRIVLEGTGCLVVGKDSKNNTDIHNSIDLKEMFNKAISHSKLHDPINLEEKDESGNVTFSKVHHVGLLAVVDQAITRKHGSSFLDQAKEEVSEKLPLQGTVFTGYLSDKNNYKATVYTFYKTHGLPSRLSKGLVQEYEEFRKKQQEFTFKSDSIEQIATTSDDYNDLDIDFKELGIDLPMTEESHTDEPEIDINNLDLSDIDDDDLN